MNPAAHLHVMQALRAAATRSSTLSMQPMGRRMAVQTQAQSRRLPLPAAASWQRHAAARSMSTATTAAPTPAASAAANGTGAGANAGAGAGAGAGSSGAGAGAGAGAGSSSSSSSSGGFFGSDSWTKTVGTVGAIANWAIPMAAITHMMSNKDPATTIDPTMTSALAVYSVLFMRWALAVTPANYPLLLCHVANEAAQLTQLGRYFAATYGKSDAVVAATTTTPAAAKQ